jgi:nucleoid-associated protein YgaU
MTRETKIGLLVGLAFIIVIGILLSDHMTSTTEPAKAPLSVAGGNVRESVAAPSGQAGQPTAAVATGVAVNAPAQPVLTQQEVATPSRPAVQNIQVGPGPSAAPAPSPITINQTAQAAPPAQAPVQVTQTPPAAGAAAEPPVTFVPPAQPQRGAVHPIQGIAAKYGEDVVVFGEAGAAGAARSGAPVPMSPLREYKAQPGDSLSKLASKYMGSASKANREAIVRANPSLQQNPDKIVAGRTYFLPAPVAAANSDAGTAGIASPQAAGTVIPPAAPTVPTAVPAAAPAADNFNWYTVKENDNLWKIAADQLGSGNAWTQIRDLNQDVLKGEDRLTPNMRIKLPKQQPVASAN